MTKDLVDNKRFYARVSQICGRYGGETDWGLGDKEKAGDTGWRLLE